MAQTIVGGIHHIDPHIEDVIGRKDLENKTHFYLLNAKLYA